MKAVKNTIKPCFFVGHHYVYVGEEEEEPEFEITCIEQCAENWSCHPGRLGQCDHTKGYDNNDQEWCGIYTDFEEV